MRQKTKQMEWFYFACLSALFAAMTAILAKIGIDGVNSNLATAIRTVVVLVIAFGIVIADGSITSISDISPKSLVFLILSGLATGASWLCYFRAIDLGEVSKVVPIDKLSTVLTIVLAVLIFHEEFSLKTILGIVFITAGTLIMTL